MWLCHICDKPFSKESSHKRHVSYCRRTQFRLRIRPKSCRTCNISKVKCTFQAPCRRCTDKGLECIYEVPKRSAIGIEHRLTASDKPIDQQAPTEASDTALLVLSEPWSNTFAQDALLLDGSIEDLNVLNVAQSHMNFSLDDVLTNPESQELVTYDALNALTRYENSGANTSGTLSAPSPAQHPPSPPWMWSPSPVSIQPQMGHAAQAPWSTWTRGVTVESTLCTPNLDKALSYTAGQSLTPTLQLLPSTSLVARHNSHLILQALGAYPLMMLRRETLPPYIHPHWHRLYSPALPEPLSSCMSIAHIYAFRSEETKSFLWRTVKAEDERFLSQRMTSTPEDLLACIQAQMIYMIMRFVDGSEEPVELNQQLVRTYQMLCKKFRNINNQIFCPVDHFYPRPSRGEWIYAESRRRTACVFFLICRCISVNTGIEGCDAIHDFYGLPLASPKTLWEAKTRVEWEAEYTAYSAARETVMHTMGTLIGAQEQSDHPNNSQLLTLWNGRIDNLGNLLNIAAGMV